MYNAKEQIIYQSIKSGLKGLKFLSKTSLMKYWKNMTTEERCKAGRLLVYMEQVADNPSLYFSRASTQDSWAERIEAMKKKSDVKTDDADSIAQDPKDIVFYNVFPILVNHKLKLQYYNFCSNILNWEYARTRNDEIGVIYQEQSAREILKQSKNIQREVNLLNTSYILRPLKIMFQQFQR